MKQQFYRRAFLQRWIASLLILSLCIGLMPVIPFGPAAPVAYAKRDGVEIINEAQTQLNLVAILVEKQLIQDKSKYKGLALSYPALNSVDLRKRVERYAEDVQADLPFTKTIIIEVDTQTEGVFDIASTLEKLYFDGDGSGDGSTALIGTVLIGDLPLPVVNKNGNRFISMLPYTDFHEKSYIYNPDTGDYENDNRVNFPRTEIWHGVINAPAELESQAQKAEAISVFLDKNHLYHIGNEDFADFDKSILISDLFHERRLMNTGFFKYYEAFVNSSEDRAYWRYNKHWAEDLYAEFVGDITTEAEGILTDDYAASLNRTLDDGLFANIPDIHTKQAIIEKYNMPYIKLFTSYIGQLNDWVSYTGRYTDADAQSMVELISTKDLYNGEYLRLVNDTLEDKVDSIVQKALQKHIPLVSHSTLTGSIIIETEKEDEDGNIIIVEEKLPFTHKVREGDKSFLLAVVGSLFMSPDDFNHEVREFNFLNHSLIAYAEQIWPKSMAKVDVTRPVEGEEGEDGDEAPEGEEVELEVASSFDIPNVEDKFYINGIQATEVRNPLDCSLYRGSTQITYNNRIFNKRNAGDQLFLGVNTQAFLQYAGYDHGVKVARDTANPDPAVIFESPAWTAGIQEGDVLLEFNGVALNDVSQTGGRIMLADILPKLDVDDDKVATVKYYDKSKDEEVGPVNVTLENKNNLKWSAGCQGVNGLEVGNQTNANKCIPQLSKIPLFDPAAGKEVSEDELFSGDDIDTAHIRSCYDFYYNEEPRFKALPFLADPEFTMQPFVKWMKDFRSFSKKENSIPGQDYGDNFLDPTNRFTPTLNTSKTDVLFHDRAEQIILYNQKGFKLTFADLLQHAGSFDGVDNDGDGQVDEEDENDIQYAMNADDWAEIGERLLSKEGTFRFTVPKIASEVEISIQPNVVNWVSSMIPHREPYSTTIAAQAKSQVTESLPIDHDRYIAFVDQNGVLQKINYPNAFDASSYENFEIQIFKLAQTLVELPGSKNLSSDSGMDDEALTQFVFDSLMESIRAEEEVYGNNDLGVPVMLESTQDKVNDAIIWNSIGIDDKHSYILSAYLDPSKNAYADERNGYEALYFISDGEADFASYAFYGDYPNSALDSSFNAGAGDSSDLAEDFIGIGDGLESSEAALSVEEQLYNLALAELAEGIPLWEWFPKIVEWVEETASSVGNIAAARPGLKLMCAGDGVLLALLLAKAAETPAATTDTKLARLEISLDRTVLQSNGLDSANLIVKSLNVSNELITSQSLSKVEIIISSDGKKIVIPNSTTTQIVDGLAAFKLTSTFTTGQATLQVATTNTSQRILSNPITLRSTLRSIGINSFEIADEDSARLSSDSMFADGASSMRITAALLDVDKKIIARDSSSQIVFTIEPESQNSVVLGSKLSAVKSGVAETTIESTTVAGMVTIKASLKDGSLPIAEREIFIRPNELAEISILPQSGVVKTGGISYTPVHLQFEDVFGNIKNDEIFQTTLWHDGPGEFRSIQDQDLMEPGIQVMVIEGVLDFLMASTDEPGEIVIHAETEIPEIGTESAEYFYSNVSIISRSDIFLSASSKTNELKADGQSQALLELSVQDADGLVEHANLPLTLSFGPPGLANITSAPPSKFVLGLAFVTLQSRTISGDVSFSVSSPGFDDASISVPIKALDPFRVKFIKPEHGLVSDDESSMELEAIILDIHGNHVKDDQESQLSFTISDSTANVGKFITQNPLTVQEGGAKAVLKSTLFSGPVRISVSGEGLAKGDAIEIFSEKRFTAEALKRSNADVLFASLLGNSFGDITRKNSMANSMLFNSATEAIASVTTSMKQYKTILSISSTGKLDLDNQSAKSRYSVSNNFFTSDRINVTNANNGHVVAEVTMILPDESKLHLDEEISKPGVYLSDFIDKDVYTIEVDEDRAILYFDDLAHVEINKRGQINILAGSYTIKPLLNGVRHMSFQVKAAGKEIITVSLVPALDQDVRLVSPSVAFTENAPSGVYLIDHSLGQDISIETFFSGNSTHGARGFAMKDKKREAQSSQRIGGPHTSLDSAFDKAGVGFTGQNKHMLLFFAGNHAGASFMPYASEAGIMLGDPTVKINALESNNVSLFDANSGFTEDLGQSIFTDSSNAQSIEIFDYNSDGIDDLLIAYEVGLVRLLEGVKGSHETPFRDRGWLLNIVNGINDLAIGDINHDGQEDIVVATKESCNAGESCVYFYINDNGHFVHQNAGLNLVEKVSDLEIEDLNNDGRKDIVLTDMNRSVLAFYANEDGINTQGQRIGGLEPEVDEGINAAHQTFISYDRSSVEIDVIKNSNGFDPFIKLTLPSNNSTDSGERAQPLSGSDRVALAGLSGQNSDNITLTLAPVRGFKTHEFLPLDVDLRVKKSIKSIKDSNGGKVDSGDILEYSISIVNAGAPIYNASILDYVPETFKLDEASISCEGCTFPPDVIATGMPSRPYLISGLNLVSGGIIKVKYFAKASTFPPLKLLLGEELDDYPDDEYIDILVHPDGVPSNRVIYYSDSQDERTGYIIYKEKFPLKPSTQDFSEPLDTSPQDLSFTPASEDANGNGIPDSHEGIDEDSSKEELAALLPSDEDMSALESYFSSMQGDEDFDGIPDNLDSLAKGLVFANVAVQQAMASLKCNGGCFPVPINQTLNIPFPVPGNINLFGVKGPFVPGIPILSINKPSTLAPPVIVTPIWPAGNPAYFESLFRIYMSPTLTGGLGTAICVGDYAYTEMSKSNSCFIFAIPLLQALGVCKALAQGLVGALDGATAVLKSKGEPGTIITDGTNPGLFGSSYSDTGFRSGPYSTAPLTKTNVRIPGFPSVITNWFDRQTEEIIDKLTDLPDIYLIIPETSSMIGLITPKEEIQANNVEEVLSFMNSIPLIQIEQRPILISFPWIPETQVNQLALDYTYWMRDLEHQFNNVYKSIGCESKPFHQFCQEFTKEFDNLMYAAQANLIALNKFKALPRRIQQFRNLEAKYVSQVLCYTDTLVEYSSAYMKRQQLRIQAWKIAAIRIERLLDAWGTVMDVSITYAESCDACKNDKFSLLEVMLRLLVVIPSPPIIELPKWPDIVLDVSQIQAGMSIVIPDVAFVPKPMAIPQLPSVDFSKLMRAGLNDPLFKDPSLLSIDGLDPKLKDALTNTGSGNPSDLEWAKLDIKTLNFPRIPEIPNPDFLIPDLPSLPPLPLPTLPDLPPPPKIPALPKPVMSIAQTFQTLFRIFCLIKLGIMPLDEPQVSTEFETLTQRPNSPILPAPFDMSAAFQLPPINYNYVDEIEIILKINLQLDFDILYDLVFESSQVINATTTFGMKNYTKTLSEGVKTLYGGDKVAPGPGLYESINSNTDLSSYMTPELQDLLDNEMTNLNKNLIAYQKEVDAINEYSRSLPDRIVVKGTSEMIDTSHPLFNHDVNDVKRMAQLRDESMVSEDLLALRDGLIAHNENLNETNSLFDTANNSDHFIALLSTNNPRPVFADSELVNNSNVAWPTIKKIESKNSTLDSALVKAKKMKARIVALTDDDGSAAVDATQGASPKGMFIYDEDKGINHNLITYTAEIGTKSHLAYIDVDQDDDSDIIYSFGGDIYLKRNYLNHTEASSFTGKPEFKTLAELRPASESINYLETVFVGNEQVELAWDPSSAEDLLAYELLIKYRFNDLDKVKDSIGSIAHFVQEDNTSSQKRERPDYFRFFVLHGWIELNGERFDSNLDGDANIIKPGTRIQTSENLDTEIHLLAFSTRDEFIGTIRVGPETEWIIPSMGNGAEEFELSSGEMILDLRNTPSPFLQAGDELITENSRILLLNDAGQSYLVNEDQSLTMPKVQQAAMYVKSQSFLSKSIITSYPRAISSQSLGNLVEGDMIHMMSDGTIKAVSEGDTLLEIKLKMHDLYEIPNALPVDTIFEVSAGKAEAILRSHAKTSTNMQDGMAILPGDFATMIDSSATLAYSGTDAELELNNNQIFGLFTFKNPEKPSSTIRLLNGNYYSEMLSITRNGERGSGSLSVILPPQSCADKSAPYINVGETEKLVPIFKTVSIDASSSFDAAGNITSYYADINLGIDSDGDGDPSNDKNQFSDLSKFDTDGDGNAHNDMDNPVFTFGPYDEPGTHKVKIFAEDQSGNASGQVVNIKVFVPEIFLDASTANSGVISGYIKPAIDDMPFSIIRDRNPPLSIFTTDAADENKKYYTDAAGEFVIDDFNTFGGLVVQDKDGNPVADIDAETGNIKLINPNFRVEIWPARPPDLPTRAVILDKNDRVMGSFFIVPDLNNDTEIVEDFARDKKVVQISPEDKQRFEFIRLSSLDADNPGATEIILKEESLRMVLINSSGNIFTFDKRISLTLDPPKDNVFNIHIINILFEGQQIARVFIPGLNADGEMEPIPERDLYKLDALGDIPNANKQINTDNASKKAPFIDVQPGSQYFDSILELKQKGIIDGYNENGQILYKPDKLISRAEYTKILLRTLCIDPRQPEAYNAPSPFLDMQHNSSNLVWYYPFVKESFLQDFIQGYVGEMDEESGLSPFKPGNTITRAEAATIILSALNTLKIMDLDGVEPGEPWYAPYMEISLNLAPYLVSAKANSQVFLLTPDEAAAPNDQITRSEFAVMAQRVLRSYNCFEIDDDNDGIPSYWEKKYGLNPFSSDDGTADPDNDGLSNREEFENGTDPFNSDTDGGCMLDGEEVLNGFNPFDNPNDDDPDLDGLSCADEINIYKTDPYVADTDGGGVNDGREVLENNTDPLYGADDLPSNTGEFDDFKGDLPEGVYAIEESCRSCPCQSSLANGTDIIEGDAFWAIISAPDNIYNIYRKSNSVLIKSLP